MRLRAVCQLLPAYLGDPVPTTVVRLAGPGQARRPLPGHRWRRAPALRESGAADRPTRREQDEPRPDRAPHYPSTISAMAAAAPRQRHPPANWTDTEFPISDKADRSRPFTNALTCRRQGRTRDRRVAGSHVCVSAEAFCARFHKPFPRKCAHDRGDSMGRPALRWVRGLPVIATAVPALGLGRHGRDNAGCGRRRRMLQLRPKRAGRPAAAGTASCQPAVAGCARVGNIAARVAGGAAAPARDHAGPADRRGSR
jgi:hypothetical protein